MKTPVSSELYDKDYYAKFNHGFDVFETSGDIMPELKVKFTDVDFSGKKVLDIGCGRGEFIVFAVKKGATETTGIDYSQASVDIAHDFTAKVLPDKKDSIKILKMDAKKLEFADDSFDFVVLLDVVEHLHDWELKQCLSEVKRVLKADGKVFIHTSPNKLMMSLVRAVAKLAGVTLKSSEFHVNEQTFFSLKNYLEKDFNGQYTLEKDVKYWSHQMDYRGPTLKKIAAALDGVIDFPVIHSLMSLYPLDILFCTDLWFIGTKK